MSLTPGEFFRPTDPGVACRDGTPYPEAWGDRWHRLIILTADPARRMYGSALNVVCCYRTDAYNAHLLATGHKVAADSQHPKGNAIDLEPARLVVGHDAVLEFHDMVLRAHAVGQLPELGGVGLYPGFVHLDTFKAPDGHLRRWNERA